MKKTVKECNVPNCSAAQYRAGVCRPHYSENYRVEECLEENCFRKVFAKGRCKGHYIRRWKKKHPDKYNTETPLTAPVRNWGEKKFEVFTRIPQVYADLLLEEAGRPDGMYERAREILIAYARTLEAKKRGAATTHAA